MSKKYASVCSVAFTGIEPVEVKVMAHITTGLPAFHVVGLGDGAVKSMEDRVLPALENSGYVIPNGVITISMSLALTRKTGYGYDLPVAIAILEATEQIKPVSKGAVIFGGLDRQGQPTASDGLLVAAKYASENNKTLVCSDDAEIPSIIDIDVAGVGFLETLRDGIEDEHGKKIAGEVFYKRKVKVKEPPSTAEQDYLLGSGHINLLSQEFIRAAVIAAAGKHSTLLHSQDLHKNPVFANILHISLPAPSKEEQLKVGLLRSVAGRHYVQGRPLSIASMYDTVTHLVGGGNPISPGLVSLAHAGVLFMGSVEKYSHTSLLPIAQAHKDGKVVIIRAQGSVEYPANFQLVATVSPCACAKDTASWYRQGCSCSSLDLAKWQEKIRQLPFYSDIQLHVPAQLSKTTSTTTHTDIKEAVERVYKLQEERGTFNSAAALEDLLGMCDTEVDTLLKEKAKTLNLTGRQVKNIMRISRTIADLEGSTMIERSHVEEALQYTCTAQQAK